MSEAQASLADRASTFHSTGFRSLHDSQQRRTMRCMEAMRTKRAALVHAARRRAPGAAEELRSALRAALRPACTPWGAPGMPSARPAGLAAQYASSSGAPPSSGHSAPVSARGAAAALAAGQPGAEEDIDLLIAQCLHGLEVELLDQERALLRQAEAHQQHEDEMAASLERLVADAPAGAGGWTGNQPWSSAVGALGELASDSDNDDDDDDDLDVDGAAGAHCAAAAAGSGGTSAKPHAMAPSPFQPGSMVPVGCPCPACMHPTAFHAIGRVVLCTAPGCGLRFDTSAGAGPEHLPALLMCAAAAHEPASPACPGGVAFVGRVQSTCAGQTLVLGCPACGWSEIVS